MLWLATKQTQVQDLVSFQNRGETPGHRRGARRRQKTLPRKLEEGTQIILRLQTQKVKKTRQCSEGQLFAKCVVGNYFSCGQVQQQQESRQGVQFDKHDGIFNSPPDPFILLRQMKFQKIVTFQIEVFGTNEPSLRTCQFTHILLIHCNIPARLSQQTKKYFQSAWKQIKYERVHQIRLNLSEGLREKGLIQQFSTIATKHIQKHKEITELHFTGSLQEYIIFPQLQLSQFKSLKTLVLSSNKLTEQAILQLSKITFKTLERLVLQNNPIGNRGIKHLSKMRFSQQISLHLGQNNFSCEGLKYLFKIVAPQIKLHFNDSKFDCGMLRLLLHSRIPYFCYQTQEDWCAGNYVMEDVSMEKLHQFISKNLINKDKEYKKMHLKMISAIGLRKVNIL